MNGKLKLDPKPATTILFTETDAVVLGETGQVKHFAEKSLKQKPISPQSGAASPAEKLLSPCH